MTKRTITFEIDEKIAGHFDSLVLDWNKDPVWLARAFFEEEVMANVSGSRGIPMSRRYLYRDPDVYFTAEELAARSKEIDAYWQSAEGLAVKEEQHRRLESMGEAMKRRKQGTHQ
jgi:hypothetical protein